VARDRGTDEQAETGPFQPKKAGGGVGGERGGGLGRPPRNFKIVGPERKCVYQVL